MIFHSHEFIFIFLPVALVGFYALGSLGARRSATIWLATASLVFYAAWNPQHLPLLLASILANGSLGRWLARREAEAKPTRAGLAVGVGLNLAALGYFKYANFLVDNLAVVSGTPYSLDAIVLPLAISFFTFQQIAYLVDASRGEIVDAGFDRYCLFVSFFPQLIAGPIVLQRDTIPQFMTPWFATFRPARIAVGLSAFAIGLFKKVVIADGVARYSRPVFDAAARGEAIGFLDAWTGALGYSFQIYFDFSGYSDMALGLAYLFGVRLPLNFDSPYKATSIIEFWRRWHVTLSRFLRDHLYVPLGGNRRGPARRYLNLLVTMLLGGLWHGAGWSFLLWGLLHGLFLAVNHLWRLVCPFAERRGAARTVSGLVGRALTGLAVVFAWVVFRAEALDGALLIWAGMIRDPVASFVATQIDGFKWLVFALLGVLCLGTPNTFELLARYNIALADRSDSKRARFVLAWRPSTAWATVLALIVLVSIVFVGEDHEFLYFQF